MNLCVIDSSVLLAALVGDPVPSEWALQRMSEVALAAPHLLHVEVANKLRKFVFEGKLSRDAASLAHDEALNLPIELFPYEVVAGRVWALRENVSAYDAWYVAVAELLEVPLLTLDQRLVRATGPRCAFHSPSISRATR